MTYGYSAKASVLFDVLVVHENLCSREMVLNRGHRMDPVCKKRTDLVWQIQSSLYALSIISRIAMAGSGSQLSAFART